MGSTETIKAALYVRVSKKDGSQCLANQLPECLQLASARGFEIVEEYSDRQSALARRPGFDQMMKDAAKGRFRVVVVWSLDRLGRGLRCFDEFRRLSGYGIRVISVREPWSEVDGPARDLLAAVASWVSGFERERLIERTRAGLDRARAQGRRIGRPPATVDLAKALALRAQGHGLRAIGERLRIGASTVGRALRAHDELHRPAPVVAKTGTRIGPVQPPEITVAA
jgi:DNA invertase Pin-like site-specific DNA recombinase